MTMRRRHFICAAAALAFAAHSGFAAAQDWKPTKDVEFVIPFAVGGGADIMARVIHKVMTEEKLVPVPIALVNKPGGGGAVGVGYMSASRKADPHTLVLVNGTTQITPILTPEAKTLTEVQPVMNVMLDDFVFFVKADSPWKTAADFVKDAKAKPPKTYNFSTGGTTDVMAVTILGKTTGTELNMINFNSGGEALTALLGGHVHATLGNPLEFMGHLKSGAVRAIGVFRDDRFALLPDVPTMKEQGINAPNFQMWRGDAESGRIAAVQGLSERQRGVRGADCGRGLREVPRRSGKALPRSPRQEIGDARMQKRVAIGELVLAAFFAALGLLWVGAAIRMPFWEGFAPQSGFMPLWYGVVLVGLTVAVVINLFRQGEGKAEDPIGKPILVLAVFAAGIAGLEPMGFGPAVFLMLLFMFVFIERLTIVSSVLVAAGTTAVLFLIFRTWLKVGLPVGPLGI